MKRLQDLPHKLADAPDAVLAERAGDGDAQAFEMLARRHGPLMRAYARRLVRTFEEADDVVQEALITAWKDISTVQDGTAVKAWLMRIVGHRAIDAGRRRKTHESLDDQPDAPDRKPTPDEAAVARSARRALHGALGRLPEEQRRCWVLKEFGGLSYGEIAEELGISETSVRGRLARARTTLVKEMEEWR
ncbi:ECF subfamily RNA polymerase sigma-24 subunit [Arthrobacter sp. PAMC 25486]|uniref:RNA polymerase sigma factor n=1 Tax=Arthrobacter sp. PAMC 25486 TaxID=1494608 RepID=UPI00053616CF|nr:RNA polymerase sigma factor [Arthrobacter sp. PAMC 25486]AIY02833.1 ECF subfamily RNA polymerase sigma-24 subunit [Arthrobacter sp. PAMC 25486]